MCIYYYLFNFCLLYPLYFYVIHFNFKQSPPLYFYVIILISSNPLPLYFYSSILISSNPLSFYLLHSYCGVTAPINRIYPLWGASPSRFIGSSLSVGRTNQGLDLVVVIASPTSVRVPSHIWFISFWSNHMCTTRTHGL